MPLVIYGRSKCNLCGAVLLNDERIVGIRGFAESTNDPLYCFSDEAFHEDCFLRDPRHQEVLLRVLESEQDSNRQS